MGTRSQVRRERPANLETTKSLLILREKMGVGPTLWRLCCCCLPEPKAEPSATRGAEQARVLEEMLASVNDTGTDDFSTDRPKPTPRRHAHHPPIP
jgi:hypothetical protein